MLFLNRLRLRLRSIFGRDSLDDALTSEMEFHLAEQKAELIAEGYSERDAELEARRRFGHVPSLREQAREKRRTLWVTDLFTDVAYTFRVLRKSPAFALVAILTLALGIGANSAFFATAHGVLFRPLPYAEPERLVQVEDGVSGVGPVLALRKLSKTVDYAGYFAPADQNLQRGGEAIRARVSVTTGNLASVLGVAPRLGRWFTVEEGKRVAVLSEQLWRNRFGAAPDVLGQQLLLNEKPYSIIGVMPGSFAFPSVQAEVWIPVDPDPRRLGEVWGTGGFMAVGRLLPGLTIGAAQSEIRPLAAAVRRLYPWPMPDAYGASSRMVLMEEATSRGVRPKLLVLAAATLLLLLIACGNVGNLLLARGVARRREFLMREALGASRMRLLRQLLTENLTLVLLGGVGGLAIAWLIHEALPHLFPSDTPRMSELAANPMLFTGALCSMLLTILLFTAAPLVSAFRPTRISLGLIAGQMALATTLLIGAGLMGHTLWQLAQTDSGIHAASLTSARISAGPSRCDNRERCLALMQSIEAAIASQPGVRAMHWSNGVPLSKDFFAVASAIEGHPRAPREPAFVLWNTSVTPGYFGGLGIALLEGRGFLPSDRAGAQLVTVISRSMANRFWPGESAIGKHVRPVYDPQWRTVVGVVADANLYSLAGYPSYIDGVQFLPLAQSMPQTLRLALLIETNSNQWLDALHAQYPDIVISQVATLREVRAESVADQRSTAALLGLFAVLGLVLGIAGVHGVIAHRAAQRTREIGIRLALGATAPQVVRMVTGETLAVSILGIGIGAFAAWGLSRYLKTLVFGISTHDPLAFTLSPILLLVAAMIAAAVPAWKATRTDPSITLRSQ